jgi:cation diffusion facilitator family transporter
MTELLIKLFVKDSKNTTNAKVRGKYGTFSSIVGIAVNIILAGIKFLAGVLSGSVAIIADAVNNFSDAGSSAVSFVSFKIASKPADRDHPFGHARIEYVASLIVSFLILTVGLDLLKESGLGILGLGEEQVLTITYLTFIILGISIALKLWLGLFYRSIAKKIDSSVIKASSADCFSDCISTAAVILSSVVIKLTDVQMVDSIVGLAVSVLILVAGIKILNETKNSILGEAPVEQTVKAIEDIAANYDSIVGIHDMMVHNYGPNHYIASFHAEVNGEDDIYELHDAIDNAEQEIFAKLGIVCTIHLDPIAVNDEETNELKCLAIEAARSVDNDITIHDFRAVIGNTHTNLIFDIVLPFESKLTEKEAIAAVSNAVSELRKDVNCVIKVDRG